ncbi:MAG TPA: hypothetical protein VMZ11_05645 [Mycobacteriales bacterium]|nr:hypothetical protein [Mycobacteriales bacterium]
MPLLDSARVTVLLADYIAADAGGKLTAVGAAFTLTGLGPDGHTPPQHVAVVVDVPPQHLGQDFALGISLVEEGSDAPVLVPGGTGEPEALRVAQVVQAQAPSVPGMMVPSTVPGRVQLVLGFPQGLPLQAGSTYRWTVELDGQSRPEWTAWFHVPAAAPGPVFGGPAGPSSIPQF